MCLLGGLILYPFPRHARFHGDIDGVARDAYWPTMAVDVDRWPAGGKAHMWAMGSRQFDDLLREALTFAA